MNKLEFLLFQLEHTLLLSHQNVYRSLKDGLSPEAVVNKLLGVGFNVSELNALYSWRNGSDYHINNQIGYNQFCSWGYLLDIDNAIDEYRNVSINLLSRPDLFPIVISLTGEYLFCKISKTGKCGKIQLYAPSLLVTDCSDVYDSFEMFVSTVLTCYEKHIYFFENNIFRSDYEAEQQLSKALNKKSRYWHTD
jgi:hypothetical protein